MNRPLPTTLGLIDAIVCVGLLTLVWVVFPSPVLAQNQDPMESFMDCIRACPGHDGGCMVGCRDALIDSRRAEQRARAEAREEAAVRVRATWEPPGRVWRIGNRLFWTAPSSGPMPRGYRVEEGNTVSHPWHPHEHRRAVYEHVLRTSAPARIEAEHGGGLIHRVYSPDVAAGPEPMVLVQTIRFFAARPWRSAKSRDRWRRVLQGMGVPCGIGYGGRPPECGIEPAMTAAEAQIYHDRGWSPWWGHAADVLRRLEAEGQK